MMENTPLSEFRAFRSRCMNLRNNFNSYRYLFEDKDNTDRMKEIACQFFQDFEAIFAKHLILEVCVLTDPAEQRGNNNLTIDAIVKLIKNSEKSYFINKLSENLNEFGRLVRDARRKLIAHADKNSSLAGHRLGEATPDQWDAFWNNLQEFNDEVGSILGVGPLDYSFQPEQGDVQDFITFLRRAESQERRNAL